MPISIPLVGMRFRPPAEHIVTALPLGSPLILYPEPENQYDHNAVAVLFDMREFPASKVELLATLLPPQFDVHELVEQGHVHLGYLAATGNKTAKGGPGNIEALQVIECYEYDATLDLALEGYPTVKITAKQAA